MVPGGLTEAISYFAGYLRIFDDTARDRERLDGAPPAAPPDDYTVRHPLDAHRLSFDEMQVAGTPNPALVLDDLRFIQASVAHLPKIEWPDFDDQHLPRIGSPLTLPAGGGGGGGGGGGSHHETISIKVTYQDGGAQSEIQVHQINYLADNDIIGTQDTCIADHIAAQSNAMIGTMVEQVETVIPTAWQLPQDTSQIIAAVEASDRHWQDTHDPELAPSVVPGYYLNGELQPTAPDALHPTLVSPFDSEPADTGHDLGQWADVGGNHATNAAQIVDVASSSGTMIVLGDYFRTDAIFQVNAYAGAATVDTSGTQPAGVHTDDSQSTNAAGFIQHAGVYASLPVTFAGLNWDIDVVDGDYYDVRTLVQTNYVTDNDVVVQESSDSHFSVVAGENQQANFAEILNGEFQYDLIIVGGSYHGMNAVYQCNVLLNCDDITVGTAGEGGDASQSVNVGGNQLTNAATIETYGDQTFDTISDALRKVIDALTGGETSLDPALGDLVNGYGGPLRVLYITGDYYDINAIWQTNLIADSNYVLQVAYPPSAGALAQHPDGTVTQSVEAGHNVLLNDASIIAAGNDQTYVGGQVYGDMILIQANLLPSDCDNASQPPDPQALALEVVAFLNDTTVQDPVSPITTTTTVTVNDDPMSSMMS